MAIPIFLVLILLVRGGDGIQSVYDCKGTDATFPDNLRNYLVLGIENYGLNWSDS